jgi:hypothetical protein
MLLSCMAMQIIHMVQGNVVITRMVQIKRCFLVTDKNCPENKLQVLNIYHWIGSKYWQ